MELWQLDIVGGIQLADGGEAKLVTGVDDHSRFCVIATVVRTATGRAVCLAFVEALQRFGIPDEVLSDNGKQFTGRFNQPRSAEVMFERICRENGSLPVIPSPAARPRRGRWSGSTRPWSVNRSTTWRCGRTWRRCRPRWTPSGSSTTPIGRTSRWRWPSRLTGSRPGLPISGCHCGYRPGCRLPWLNFLRNPLPTPRLRHPKRHRICRLRWWYPATVSTRSTWRSSSPAWCPSPGNMTMCGQQFWLSPDRAGSSIAFWADTTVVHLLANGVRLKTVPSRLTVAHLQRLLAEGARPAGPPPIPSGEAGDPIESDRLANGTGLISPPGPQPPLGHHF